jgi:hypothetical protein
MTDRFGGCDTGGAMPTRRQLWRAAGGFAIAATGVLLPETIEAAWAKQNGVASDKRRRPRNEAFRDSALTVVNKTAVALNCTFSFQHRIGYDSYDPPLADVAHSVDPDGSFRYDPAQFRVGVLVKDVDPDVDLYADVRNVQFWYPRGGVSTGANLDPPGGIVGSAFIPEQNYSQGERRKKAKIVLKRNHDSDGFIEWELVIGQPRQSP